MIGRGRESTNHTPKNKVNQSQDCNTALRAYLDRGGGGCQNRKHGTESLYGSEGGCIIHDPVNCTLNGRRPTGVHGPPVSLHNIPAYRLISFVLWD